MDKTLNKLFRNFIVLTLSFCFLKPGLFADDMARHRVKSDITYLCSPELAGRDAPGETGDKTAEWLAKQFWQIGLKPVFADTGYFQEVPLIAAVLDPDETKLKIIPRSKKKYFLNWGESFYYFPRGVSEIDKTFDVLFCDYGFSSDELNRHDYPEEVEGKAAAVIAGSGDISPEKAGRYAMAAFKAAAAKRAGATGLIIIYPVESQQTGKWRPEELERKIKESAKLKIDLADNEPDFPVIHVRLNITESIKGIGELIDKWDKINLTVKYKDLEKTHGYNVCGKVEGRKPGYIIVGAHYDHLGLNKSDTQGGYYPGADDNASGVAGMLELARKWSDINKPETGIIFIGFTAEEDGLLGSKYFIDRLPVPASYVKAMLNLDMIGHAGFASMRTADVEGKEPDPNYAALFYSAAAPKLKDVGRGAADLSALNIDLIPTGRFPYNDAGPFHEFGIPSLHLFGGFHKEYSSTDDAPENLDWEKLSKMIDFAGFLLKNLVQQPSDIPFDPTIRTHGKGMKY